MGEGNSMTQTGALADYFQKKRDEGITKENMARAYKEKGANLKRMLNLARTLGKLKEKK